MVRETCLEVGPVIYPQHALESFLQSLDHISLFIINRIPCLAIYTIFWRQII